MNVPRPIKRIPIAQLEAAIRRLIQRAREAPSMERKARIICDIQNFRTLIKLRHIQRARMVRTQSAEISNPP